MYSFFFIFLYINCLQIICGFVLRYYEKMKICECIDTNEEFGSITC